MTPLLLVFATTVASAAHTPADCPQIFGSEARRAHQRAVVDYAVDGVEKNRQSVRVFHRMGKWRAPKPVSLAGLRLVSVDEKSQTALVELNRNEVCPTGPYRVSQGDSIGAGGFVLGITDRGVLYGDEKRIQFLRMPSARPPLKFEMVWRSDYRVFDGGSGAGASPVGKKATPRSSMRTADTGAVTKPGEASQQIARDAARKAREAAAAKTAGRSSGLKTPRRPPPKPGLK